MKVLFFSLLLFFSACGVDTLKNYHQEKKIVDIQSYLKTTNERQGDCREIYIRNKEQICFRYEGEQRLFCLVSLLEQYNDCCR